MHRGFPFVDSGRSGPEHSLTWAFVCSGLLGGGGGRKKKKRNGKSVFVFFFFLLPPPQVCTYSGPCEEPCSRSEWPAATKGSPYVSTYLLRKDTKSPKSGLKQKTQKLGPVVRRVLKIKTHYRGPQIISHVLNRPASKHIIGDLNNKQGPTLLDMRIAPVHQHQSDRDNYQFHPISVSVRQVQCNRFAIVQFSAEDHDARARIC